MDIMRSSNYQKYNNGNPFSILANNLFLKSIWDIINYVKPENILDIGCGEGFVIRQLIKNDNKYSVRGVDCNMKYLNMARQLNPDTEFILGNIYNLPFLDRTFDLLICLETLEHLKNVDKALFELRRVTSRYCLVSVPYEPCFTICRFLGGKNMSNFGRHPEHVHCFNKRKICETVSAYFNIKKISISFPWVIVLAEA
jgi:SAM-dependent methyltransferase